MAAPPSVTFYDTRQSKGRGWYTTPGLLLFRFAVCNAITDNALLIMASGREIYRPPY